MDAGQSDVAPDAKHGTTSVAAGEEDGLLAVNDHWEVEHRAHEAGAEMPRRSHAIATITVVNISNVMSTLMWTTGHRQKSPKNDEARLRGHADGEEKEEDHR